MKNFNFEKNPHCLVFGDKNNKIVEKMIEEYISEDQGLFVIDDNQLNKIEIKLKYKDKIKIIDFNENENEIYLNLFKDLSKGSFADLFYDLESYKNTIGIGEVFINRSKEYLFIIMNYMIYKRDVLKCDITIEDFLEFDNPKQALINLKEVDDNFKSSISEITLKKLVLNYFSDEILDSDFNLINEKNFGQIIKFSFFFYEELLNNIKKFDNVFSFKKENNQSFQNLINNKEKILIILPNEKEEKRIITLFLQNLIRVNIREKLVTPIVGKTITEEDRKKNLINSNFIFNHINNYSQKISDVLAQRRRFKRNFVIFHNSKKFSNIIDDVDVNYSSKNKNILFGERILSNTCNKIILNTANNEIINYYDMKVKYLLKKFLFWEIKKRFKISNYIKKLNKNEYIYMKNNFIYKLPNNECLGKIVFK